MWSCVPEMRRPASCRMPCEQYDHTTQKFHKLLLKAISEGEAPESLWTSNKPSAQPHKTTLEKNSSLVDWNSHTFAPLLICQYYRVILPSGNMCPSLYICKRLTSLNVYRLPTYLHNYYIPFWTHCHTLIRTQFWGMEQELLLMALSHGTSAGLSVTTWDE